MLQNSEHCYLAVSVGLALGALELDVQAQRPLGGCLSGLRLPEGLIRGQSGSLTSFLTGRLSEASNRPLCLSLSYDSLLPYEQGT